MLYAYDFVVVVTDVHVFSGSMALPRSRKNLKVSSALQTHAHKRMDEHSCLGRITCQTNTILWDQSISSDEEYASRYPNQSRKFERLWDMMAIQVKLNISKQITNTKYDNKSKSLIWIYGKNYSILQILSA